MRQHLRVLFVLAGALVLIYLLNEYNNRLADELQQSEAPVQVQQEQVQVQEELLEGFQDENSQQTQQAQQQQAQQQQAQQQQAQQQQAQQQQARQQVGMLPEPVDLYNVGAPLTDVQQAPVRATRELPKDCFPKDQLTPAELLPGDANSKWAQVNPAGQGELKDVNFLDAGYHLGVNTVGQSLRNANRQLRSEPSNPQVKVSPWNQTTIEPDISRRPLE